MAVMPDRRLATQDKRKMLRINKIDLHDLQCLVKIKEKGGGSGTKTEGQAEAVKPTISGGDVKTLDDEELATKNETEATTTTSKVTLCSLDYATPLPEYSRCRYSVIHGISF